MDLTFRSGSPKNAVAEHKGAEPSDPAPEKGCHPIGRQRRYMAEKTEMETTLNALQRGIEVMSGAGIGRL